MDNGTNEQHGYLLSNLPTTRHSHSGENDSYQSHYRRLSISPPRSPVSAIQQPPDLPISNGRSISPTSSHSEGLDAAQNNSQDEAYSNQDEAPESTGNDILGNGMKGKNFAIRVDQLSKEPAGASLWLPPMMRSHFFALPLASSLALCLVVSLLLWKSHRDHGLGSDDGSSSLLFGWRFTPTLIAVLYVQQVVMLFEDIKRTEPFARLANSSAPSAPYTILQSPRQWWFCITDALSKKKNGGKRSWALLLATSVHIIGFLGISPLSASFLLSTEVYVPTRAEFFRMAPDPKSTLTLRPNRETYFRTIGNLLQNVSTSAWLPSSYSVMPFWPSNMEAHLGASFNESAQSWRAETTVFKNEFECKPFNITGRGSRTWAEPVVDDDGEFSHEMLRQTVSVTMESTDGCQYGLEMDAMNIHFLIAGGAQWTNLTTLYTAHMEGEIYLDTLASSESLDWPVDQTYYFRANHSQQCNDREILIATTALTDGRYPPTNKSSTPSFFSNHTMQAHVCSSTPYMANIPVVVTTSSTETTVDVDEEQFLARRVPVPESFLNHSSLQEYYLQLNWSSYMAQSYILSNGAEFAASAALLGSFYGFDSKNIAKASDLTEQAARIRSRFFDELLLASLLHDGAAQQEKMVGELTMPHQRVIVVTEVAIALATLFLVSSILLTGLFFLTRPSRRDLQLSVDPGFTAGAASLLTPEPTAHKTFLQLSGSSRDIEEALKDTKYSVSHGTLHEIQALSQVTNAIHASHASKHANYRPFVARLRGMFLLIVYLLCLAAALVILYHFARQSRLYQTAFVYEVNLPFFNDDMSGFAPYSMVPTLLAICVSLWWDALDKSMRSTQPYLSMSKGPTKLSDGVLLSYQSCYWAWAAVKALFHRHWFLFAITFGSTLSQIFVVSMSALFERSSGNLATSIAIEHSLEFQQAPSLAPMNQCLGLGTTGADDVLKDLFSGLSTNWMYTATIQLVLNGSQPVWSQDGWSFTPVDISHINESTVQKTGSRSNDKDDVTPFSSVNISLNTPAIRGRVECSPIGDVGNVSTWLSSVNLSDSRTWNTTTNPKDWTNGYSLNRLFDIGNTNASLFANPSNITCCGNGTSNTDDNATVGLGYWSSLNTLKQPHAYEAWPINFTSKWIYGQARNDYRVRYNSAISQFNTERQQNSDHLVFEEPPSLQALTCSPIIETADAEVTIDKDTRQVLSYNIRDQQVHWAERAWTDPFVIHNTTEDGLTNGAGCPIMKITTSYGVMFMSAMLGAPDLTSLRGGGPRGQTWDLERLEDMTFNIRNKEQGLNMDFMTYAMYSMVNRDPTALLNATTLYENTQKAFQTFFQHFVSSNVSAQNGGWAYQPIGMKHEDPGPVVNISEIAGMANNLPGNYSNNYPVLDTARSATATMTTRIEVLQMNAVATFLSVAILIWLAVTTLLVAAVHRDHLKSLNRDVDRLADVLVWLAGSDNLLKLVRERTVDEMKKDKTVWTRLGWFKDSRGVVRWGIEAEGGRGMRSVEWVEAPSIDSSSARATEGNRGSNAVWRKLRANKKQ